MPGVTTAYQTGIHASRPAANAGCILYSCTTHGLVYRSDGSSWTTFLTLSGGTPAAHAASHQNGGSDEIDVTGLTGLPIWADLDGDHDAHDHTGVPGVGGGGGGATYGQSVAYPTTFSGDTIDGSSATPYADVAAFDVKEVLNSRVLHLVTKGASKDQRVRVTLGTTKAGAFDVRTQVAAYFHNWTSAERDHWMEWRLSTSADAQLCAFRLYNRSLGSRWIHELVVSVGSGTPIHTSMLIPYMDPGAGLFLRLKRDGSNNVLAYFGRSTAPLACIPMLDDTFVPKTAVTAGTLARVEYALHTPSGPIAGTEQHLWIDYMESV